MGLAYVDGSNGELLEREALNESHGYGTFTVEGVGLLYGKLFWVMVGLWREGFGFETGCWGRVMFMFVLCAGLGKGKLIV